ncbi:MAG: phosphoenolpyruvate synthase [Vulcanimicrobiota bacterium]
MKYIRWFDDLGLQDVGLVGGKNASLGEMRRNLSGLGIPVPPGFAVTAVGYRYFVAHNGLEPAITELLTGLDRQSVESYNQVSEKIRDLMTASALPADLAEEILHAYQTLGELTGQPLARIAVRSSATAEDLPTASFAGQQESFLHVQGGHELLRHVVLCLASLYTARAMAYREDQGFAHSEVALSVGVQHMVMADQAASGVMFTLDTESGFRDVVSLSAIWGLGENLVQGRVGPDEFLVHKPTLKAGFRPILRKKLGPKELRLGYDSNRRQLVNQPVSARDRQAFALNDDQVLQLAGWALKIEEHYGKPMDIEWAQDGPDGPFYIVQARPETVHSQHDQVLKVYSMKQKGTALVRGLAVGSSAGAGKVRVIREARDIARFQAGEILVTSITDPDWEPIMKIAAGIVTERGGRTSHAAIVARELGIPAVVGAPEAMSRLDDEREVTLVCFEGEVGTVYDGRLEYQIEEVRGSSLPETRTQIMLNLGNPDQAFGLAAMPVAGIGLARMEFIFASWVRVHPLALTRFEQLPTDLRGPVEALTRGYADKPDYFVDKLSQGIAMLAAAFYPRPVILRFSDFKTNEYRHLLGGAPFEPEEENPMLGWRGASRYYHPGYKDGFLLEVAAVRRVREQMGLSNLKVMVPFCRTPEEGRKVLEAMKEGGLERGQGGLEVYCMAELPSNFLQAEEFAQLFDGFSIGSNDLTQLILGVDRDSAMVAPLFSERNAGVKEACARIIRLGHQAGIRVGICGQAPSDYVDFALFLVEQKIDSISLTPDAVLRTLHKVADLEKSELGVAKV